MTNEEKIKELFPLYEDMVDAEAAKTVFNRQGALVMAKYKDKQFRKYIDSLIDYSKRTKKYDFLERLEDVIKDLGL